MNLRMFSFATVMCLSSFSEATSAAERPAIVGLEVYPPKLELSGNRDARRVIVSAKDAEGRLYDVSGEAKLVPAGGQVGIDRDGFIEPKAVGETKVTVTAAGHSVDVPVAVKTLETPPVSFIREIIPITSKVGCNQGTCHGSQQGKAGFKLSLRGYDPLYDYTALVDDISGRRFNRAVPAQSLMLLKPTQGVPHEGGFLFDEESRYYDLIEKWIAEGCKYQEDRRVERIEVYPQKPILQRTDSTQQMIVLAFYPDGTSRDVTREAVFDTSSFEVATVTASGVIKAVRRGEAAALVRYEGLYAANLISVLGDREGYQWQASPEHNFVDTLVNKKLQRVKLLPSELCSDADFLRRVSFDLAGIPPTSEQVRAFLADTRDTKTKREAKIEELLESSDFIDHWTLKWSDLLMSNRKTITEKGVWAFRNWLRASLAENKPYDQFVYELLTSSGSTFENPATNYYRVAREPSEVMENMTQVFLGTRFNCNKCHDHPFERWTQRQYYELSGFLTGVVRKPGSEKDEEIVYSVATGGAMKHPTTGQMLPSAFPFKLSIPEDTSPDARIKLGKWITAKENPYFAKSIVNRYWSYLLGMGIIDPVDDIRAGNPPSNTELLDALTADFIAHNFDLKYLVRTIVSSHTYQRALKTNQWNEGDNTNFSHALPRRLTAEQLYDAIQIATGAPTNIPGVPAGFRATQLPDPQINLSFLDMFGRPPRESPCECERTSDVSLGQTLNLINGPTIADAIAHPQAKIARLVAEKADNKKLVEEIYLTVVCRMPSEDERTKSEAYLAQIGNPTDGAQDLMWALINSPAFLFNR